MRFSCPYCHTHYRIEREKLANRVLRIKCKVCHNALAIRDPQLALQVGAGAGDSGATTAQDSPTSFPAPPPSPSQTPPPPPIDVDANWFYADGRSKIGPLPLSLLQERAAAGTIQPRTYVWCPSLDGWQHAGEVGAFAGLFAPVRAAVEPGLSTKARIRSPHEVSSAPPRALDVGQPHAEEHEHGDEVGFESSNPATEIVDSEKAARLRSLLVANLAGRDVHHGQPGSPHREEPEKPKTTAALVDERALHEASTLLAEAPKTPSLPAASQDHPSSGHSEEREPAAPIPAPIDALEPDPATEALDSAPGDGDTLVLPEPPEMEDTAEREGAGEPPPPDLHLADAQAVTESPPQASGLDASYRSADENAAPIEQLASDDQVNLQPDTPSLQTSLRADDTREAPLGGEGPPHDASSLIGASTPVGEPLDAASELPKEPGDVQTEDLVLALREDAPKAEHSGGEGESSSASTARLVAADDVASAFFENHEAGETLEEALAGASVHPPGLEAETSDPTAIAALRESLGEEPAHKQKIWLLPTLLAVAAGVVAVIFATRPDTPTHSEQPTGEVIYAERNEPKRPQYSLPARVAEGNQQAAPVIATEGAPEDALAGNTDEAMEQAMEQAEQPPALEETPGAMAVAGAAGSGAKPATLRAAIPRVKQVALDKQDDRELTAQERAALLAQVKETTLEPIRPVQPAAAALPDGGQVSQASIAKVFQLRAREVHRCAQAASFTGKMLISFDVDTSGRPSKPNVSAPEGVPAATRTCIEELVGKLAFPPPAAPLSFQRTFLLE